MADWGQRAKDKDRDNAIKQIEAAAARGQLIEVDKLKRIHDVKSASTVGEIEMITRGLTMPEPAAAVPPTPAPIPAPIPTPMPEPTPATNATFEPYSPPQTPPVTEPDPPSYGPPPPNVQYGEPLTPSGGVPISYGTTSTKSGHGGKFVLLFVLIMMAGVAIPIFFGIKAVVDTAGDTIDSLTPSKADVFSEKGLADLTAAIEEETGSTEVFRVVLYPEYASVWAPADATSKRYVNYHWDGSLSESSKGTDTTGSRVDMAGVDAAVLKKLLAQARKLVEGATSNYAIVSGSTFGQGGPTISAYASNDFSESGYVEATLDGKIVRKVSPS